MVLHLKEGRTKHENTVYQQLTNHANMSTTEYIIEVIICSGTFMALYRWLLARKVGFRLCRIYLMITMMLSATIPAMNVPVYVETDTFLSELLYIDQMYTTGQIAQEQVTEETSVKAGTAMTVHEAEMSENPATGTENASKPDRTETVAVIQTILMAVYVMVALAGLSLIIYNGWRIGRLRRRSRLTYTEEYTLAESQEIKTPFSFLRTIFMGFDYESSERQQILTHEASHVRHGHSFERLALATLRSVYWFNPFFYMAERHLEEVQEWEADKDVLNEGYGLNTYRTTIFKQLFGYNPDISCGLNHSLTKQRFIMMTQSHRDKGAWIRLAFTLPVIAAMFFAFGCGARSPQEAHPKAGSDLADTTAIHFQMPCNPIRIMNGYGSRPAQSVFSRKHTGIDFALDEGDPIWAVADGHLMSIELGNETIIKFDEESNTMSVHQPKNVTIASGEKEAGKFHFGDVDIDLDMNGNGTCEFRCGPESEGLTVRIRHDDGIETVYRQVPYIALRPDKIRAGQMIGKAGMTARSTGVHLHFEVHKDGEPVDPAPYLSSSQNVSRAVFIEIKKTGENENRLQDRYVMEIDGERKDFDEVGETVTEKIAKDSTISLVQITADPLTPMGYIDDIKKELRAIPGLRLAFVGKKHVTLPPSEPETTEEYVKRHNLTVMHFGTDLNNIIIVRTNAEDRYLIGPKPGYLDEESENRLKGYIRNKDNDKNCPNQVVQELTLPDGSTITWPVSQAMIIMQHDRGTSFEGYQAINTFVNDIYIDLREDAAMKIFGRPWTDLSEAEMEVIRKAEPMRVHEMNFKETAKSRLVGWMK